MGKKRSKYKGDEGGKSSKERGAAKDAPKTRGSRIGMYSTSEQSLNDCARLAFSDVLGLEDRLNAVNAVPGLKVSVSDGNISTLPGILALEWEPSIGSCEENPDTPINVASLNTYSYVRHANSGSKVYDHPDLMMLIIAVANVFAWLGALIRLYGVMSVFNQKNRYMPRALVHALGFDYDDIVMHLNDLRGYVNHKIAEASVLWIPNTMQLVSEWFSMNSNIYTDGESYKSQLYVFRQRSILKFRNKTSTEGTKLQMVTLPDKMTFDQIVTFTNDLMMPLISDEDAGIMCGDILKAFGSEKIYGMSQIPDEYTVMPIYDEEILMMIHNADVCNGVGDIEQNNSTDPGFIYQKWWTHVSAASGIPWPAACCRRYFDLKGNANDPAMVMIASRLKCSYRLWMGQSADTVRIQPVNSGSMVVTGLKVYTKPNDVEAIEFSWIDTSANGYLLLKLAAIMSKFHWAPMLYGVQSTISGTNVSISFSHLIGEFDNFTTIGDAELSKLNRAAMYGLLGIPYI